MKKHILTLALAATCAGFLGHLLAAQSTPLGTRLDAPSLDADNVVICQSTYGVRTRFQVRQVGLNSSLDIKVVNYDASLEPGFLSIEQPHSAGVFVNDVLVASTTVVQEAATALELSVPIDWIDQLFYTNTSYDLKVWNSSGTQIFGCGVEGQLF